MGRPTLTLVVPGDWAAIARRRVARHWPDLDLRLASAPADGGWRTGDVVWWPAQASASAPPVDRLALDRLAAEAGVDLVPFGAFAELERAEDGRLYGLPVGYSAQLLWYRPDILARTGVPLSAAALTWDGLLEAVAALRRAGVRCPFGSGAFGWTAALLAWQAGADPARPDGMRPFVERVRALREAAALGPLGDGDPALGGAALEIESSDVQLLNLPRPGSWGVLPLPPVDA